MTLRTDLINGIHVRLLFFLISKLPSSGFSMKRLKWK